MPPGIANLHALRGLHVRRGWFPQCVTHIKTWVLHCPFRARAFLQFDLEMIFLADTEKFFEEKNMILLVIRTQTYIMDVVLHLRTTGDQLLCEMRAPQYVQNFIHRLVQECRSISRGWPL